MYRVLGAYCLHHRPDNGGSTHLRNVGLLQDYTALHPRRRNSHSTTRRSACFNIIRRQSRVANTPSYLGGPGFHSRPGDRLS
jgi:hypothetical protein